MCNRLQTSDRFCDESARESTTDVLANFDGWREPMSVRGIVCDNPRTAQSDRFHRRLLIDFELKGDERSDFASLR